MYKLLQRKLSAEIDPHLQSLYNALMTTIALEDLKAHPELLIALLDEDDKTWIIRRKGETITVSPQRVYSDKTNRILAEAKAKYEAKERAGYTREEAFDDLQNVLDEIERQRQ